jgi:hypothetical protein
MSDELTEAIIGVAVEVHRIFGPGLSKSIYEEALCQELLPHLYFFLPFSGPLASSKSNLNRL